MVGIETPSVGAPLLEHRRPYIKSDYNIIQEIAVIAITYYVTYYNPESNFKVRRF